MRIVIAGGHGQIALRLSRLLTARGDQVVGLIRRAEHADEVRESGAEPVVLDLEAASVEQVARELEHAEADAVVFAAGSGAGSGSERKQTMDRAGAVLLANAAESAGVRRYVMVSSMGADAHSRFDGDAGLRAYLRAKGEADDDIRARTTLDWTILRPGALRNEPGSGKVRLDHRTGGGFIPRDDAAEVLAAILATPATTRQTLEVITGDVPVEQAVATFAH